ncbi:MAG: hypothetical protein FJ088_07545, partial [Deltaproteobacteria bacterium]|nr:hypothetical protein [Deltaproteobacteria bacterium]
MKTFSKNFFSLLSVLLVAALVSFNCGGNGDGGKDVATDQGQDVQEPKDVVETAQETAADTGTDQGQDVQEPKDVVETAQETAADTGPELVTYTAVLTSFFLGTPVEGAKVTVVDNDTGTDTTTTTTSGANGAVEFQLEKGKKY